jgi:phosphocarrier protein HPr
MTDGADAAASPDGAIVRDVQIVNKKGLHARASAKFVQMAEQYDAQITVTRHGETVGGTTIRIVCSGNDAAAAMDALAGLVSNRFGEEE